MHGQAVVLVIRLLPWRRTGHVCGSSVSRQPDCCYPALTADRVKSSHAESAGAAAHGPGDEKMRNVGKEEFDGS